MDDGLNVLPSSPPSPGYDIGPDEVYMYRRNRQVEAILDLDDMEETGSRYTPVYLYHTSPTYFDEPTDDNTMESEIDIDFDSKTLSPLRDNTHFYSERERLKTYRDWKQSYHVTPLDLARNGFFYTGSGDRVVCAFCGKFIYSWERGDLVHEEHCRICPMCPFVRGESGQNKPIATTEGIRAEFNVIIKALKSEHSAFGDKQIRKETFVNWPNTNQLTPPSLIEAGFFYTGKGDMVKCYHCGTSIEGWQAGESPWTRHSRHNSKCPFVLHHKGHDFVHQANSEREK